jgi:hypothetical protein
MSWWKKEVVKKLVITRPKSELTLPNTEEVRGWLSLPAGKYYKAQLIEKLEDLKDGWVSGQYTGNSIEETVQLNSEALGKAGAIAEELLTLEELSTDEEDTD